MSHHHYDLLRKSNNVKILIFLTGLLLVFADTLAAQKNNVKNTKPKTVEVQCKLSSASLFGNKRILRHYSCPPNVTDLTLSENEIYIECKNREESCSPATRKIEVLTKAIDPEGDIMSYIYHISGGKIIGQGSNVIWDLTEADVGTYTIKASVEDGLNFDGKSITKTIIIKKCSDCKDE